MSDGAADEDREHEASEEKIRRSIARGQVPVAPEFWLLGSLCSIFAALQVLSALARPGAVPLRNLLESVPEIRLEHRGDVEAIAHGVAMSVAPSWSAVVAASLVISLLIGLIPQPPRIVRSRLKVDFARLHPRKGLERILGPKAVASFLKTAVKLILVGAALFVDWKRHGNHVAAAMWRSPLAAGSGLLDQAASMALSAAAVVAAFAAIDVAWSRWSWKKQLRMSRQELKDETKQSEGDPLVKMRMRSLALDRARKRMLTDVSSATMVIVNPTHYALALRYVREEGGAPTVVAKGQELIALKIRTEASGHDIPIVEQPELARAMYRSVEVGQAIPVEFYRAVAEIVNFLSARNASAPFRR